MKNLFTIFFSPEATFKRVKEKSKTAWIFPSVALLIISVVMMYLQMPVVEKDMINRLKKQNIDPSMIDTTLQMSKVTSLVVTPLVTVGMLFVVGLLLMLLNLIVRGEAKYMQLVTVASFGAIPGILGGLLTGIMVRTMDVQSATDITLSLGALVSDKSSQLYHILSLLNPFSIWGLVLYVLGAAVMMNRPRKKVAVWIVGVWLLFSIGSLLM
ncbi:YIP1 family protein [Paenibacillus puldeungensis]|uniref:YIP1 family protein n=1 Tax=Paenibacillus puldeungensis TaxID=696536 RepID=A0ABW3RZK5_9BACL